MGTRLQLHEVLVALGEGISVYFQPPESIRMTYPCIVYSRDSARTEYADNNPYSYTQRYQVTVIDRNPDSDIPGRVAQLPMSAFSRHFTADNLNHDVYSLYF